jgi:hypothetical protein
MLPLLAKALGVPAPEVFYTWAFRKCRQRGRLEGTDWVYFFHGLECDLKNSADGRLLRIDFGPGGRVDTFTMWGVLQFIMTSASPWLEFPDLQRQFATGEPPYNQFSGSVEKMSPVWDSLRSRGFFEMAARDLVDFEAKHTVKSPEGLTLVRFPPDTSAETKVDCSVAHRVMLSPAAHRLLQESQAGFHATAGDQAK